MQKSKAFEKAYKDADLIVKSFSEVGNAAGLTPIILALLEDLNKKLQIFETNEDGTLKLNKRGFPIVKWGFLGSRILLNLPTILAYLARIWQAARS